MNLQNKTETFEEKWQNRIYFQCSCCFTNYTVSETDQFATFWVNDDEQYGKQSACPKCGKMQLRHKWGILSHKDIYIVYTTHCEMPQSPPNFHEDLMDSEYFWETMIENTQNGKWLDFQARYKSQEDAINGHWLAYDNLENMILDPDKYPQGIMSIFFNAVEAGFDQRKNIDPHIKRNLK